MVSCSVLSLKDQDFVDLLNRIRNNAIEEGDIARLNLAYTRIVWAL